METPKIAKKGPYVLAVDASSFYWCSCGKSNNQPYCDGSHKGSEFSPIKVEISEPKTVAWCGCKKSSNPPFCDGSHAKL